MSVLKNKDGAELLLDCHCGCNEGMRFKIDKEDLELYCAVSYTNGAFYRDQDSMLGTLCKKLKKIWSIIRNKDFYYAEVLMTKDEFEEFRDYINSI